LYKREPLVNSTGLFKRLCVLLFHNIKPVIVFDGPAPTLKRRVLENRRTFRDRSGENLRKVCLVLHVI
jgi:5'-3' exonuclease